MLVQKGKNTGIFPNVSLKVESGHKRFLSKRKADFDVLRARLVSWGYKVRLSRSKNSDSYLKVSRNGKLLTSEEYLELMRNLNLKSNY